MARKKRTDQANVTFPCRPEDKEAFSAACRADGMSITEGLSRLMRAFAMQDRPARQLMTLNLPLAYVEDAGARLVERLRDLVEEVERESGVVERDHGPPSVRGRAAS